MNDHGAGAARVRIQQFGGRTRIDLEGEIDATVASGLAEAVGTAELLGLPTEVDASGITFMDSSGIALLARLATRTPRPLRVLSPPEVVRFLLEVTRIGDMVEVVEANGPSGPDDTDDTAGSAGSAGSAGHDAGGTATNVEPGTPEDSPPAA